MIAWLTGWLGRGLWRTRSTVIVAALVACPVCASTAAAAPSNSYLSIVAGTGMAGAPTPGSATSSELDHPRGVAVDPTTGDLYIASFGDSEVQKVTPQGALSIVAGNGDYGAPTPGPATSSALGNPTGVAVNPTTGDLYIPDWSSPVSVDRG
jgi:DNA-binding beta-propeller fold protein YncE